ncbi:hypothetical protein PI126_g395 [Phytophthora idaei]|nr:hypothetical protein PI126_g395 [Phytophthora idaei]
MVMIPASKKRKLSSSRSQVRMKTGFWPIDVSQFETASTDYRREKERRSFQVCSRTMNFHRYLCPALLIVA